PAGRTSSPEAVYSREAGWEDGRRPRSRHSVRPHDGPRAGGALARPGPFFQKMNAYSPSLGLLLAAVLAAAPVAARGQAPSSSTPERSGLLLPDDCEPDPENDGDPNNWYTRRDAERTQGGKVGPTCVRFRNDKPGRPARISRAFGLDGKTI